MFLHKGLPALHKEGKRMKILVTGFAPFGGQSINPSWEAVKALSGREFAAEIRLRELPVEWKAGRERLLSEIADFRPDCVLMCGQAGGRTGVSVERLGVNLCDCKAPDNAGVVLRDTPIVPMAPDALASTYPYEKILAELRKNGIPAAYSFDAGRYICNLVLWTALQAARTQYPGMQAGFIHLPFLPGQREGAPCMELGEQQRAVELIARTIIENH